MLIITFKFGYLKATDEPCMTAHEVNTASFVCDKIFISLGFGVYLPLWILRDLYKCIILYGRDVFISAVYAADTRLT